MALRLGQRIMEGGEQQHQRECPRVGRVSALTGMGTPEGPEQVRGNPLNGRMGGADGIGIGGPMG